MSAYSRHRTIILPFIGVSILVFLAFAYGGETEHSANSSATKRLRLAYFPNITHSAGIIGVERGIFQRELGSDVTLLPKTFSAGPEAMEALLAGEIDIAYVGPSPAINTYLRTQGRALRILSGASSGGASLVVRKDSPIQSLEDLKGRRLAIPQLGGTQDVSARSFLEEKGLRSRDKGGDVTILPIKPADIYALFLKKEIDAAWVPEPWASRLIVEAGGRLLIDERDLWQGGKFTTTVLVARREYMERNPEQVTAVVRAHLKAVTWIEQSSQEAQALLNSELKRLTGKSLPVEVLRQAWSRVEITTDPHRETILRFVQAAERLGYLPSGKKDIASLIDPAFLQRARDQVALKR
jgi:NitT/TauT family transport system substrate-binding protein